MDLHPCRVVLVRPTVAGNLGAAARVMRNLGLTDLVLVAPEADPADRNARQLATHGEAILENARVVADLGDAVADCVLIAGTSARTGGPFRRQSVGTPVQIMPYLIEALAQGPVALVFGPEPSGLSNAEVTRCHHLIHIPTDPTYPALNLAQAVAICLYALRRAWLARSEPATRPAPAPFADQERMFARLRSALEAVHFLYGANADTLMHALRHLIGRAGPTPMEVDVLLGLARQLHWFAGQSPQPPVAAAWPLEARQLPRAHDTLAPDGSEIRLLVRVAGASMVHCTLPVGGVSSAVAHRTVEETWYCLAGAGQVWRKRDSEEVVTDIQPGSSLNIPIGTSFQFRNAGDVPLCLVIATIPAWPGPEEAVPRPGPWEAR